MCGIAGQFRFEGSPKLPPGTLARMAHRGPDAAGEATIGGAALGNCRLAVIDPDGGAQPMGTPDGKSLLTYNGEIHDYREHAEGLRAAGVEPRDGSDTEVLLRLLERDGTDALPGLSGMFAFAFASDGGQGLTLARDPFGIKPLCYAEEPGGLRFASEASAIAPERPRVDLDALVERMAFQVPLSDRTLIDGVLTLPPGTLLTADRRGRIARRRWHHVTFDPDEGPSEEEWAERLRNVLRRAVRISLRSDVPLGVTLSGGLDSSLVTALAAASNGTPPIAFTGYFEDGPEYDERGHARRAAAEAGVDLVTIPIRPGDLLTHLRELAVALEGPIAGVGSFPQLVVAGRAREEVTVLVTGQGGDEVFGGYARMRIAWLRRQGRLDPDRLPEGLGGYRPLVRHLLANGNGESLADGYFRLVFRGGGLESLLGDAIRERFAAYDARAAFGDAFHEEDGDPFHRMTSYERRILLPALLHVEDRVTMARSLESRVPLLDPALVALAARIPSRIAFGDGELKRILRIAADGLAPPSAVSRRDKMGFPVPLGRWARGPLRRSLTERLNDGPLVREGILAAGAPERLLEAAGGHGRHLWFFLLLSEWMDATGARP